MTVTDTPPGSLPSVTDQPADDRPRQRRWRRSSPLLDVAAEFALAGVTVTTVVGFSRLFRSNGYLPPLLAIAVIAHLLFALCRRWRWSMPVTTLVGGAGFIVAVTWIRYPGSTAALLPTTTTFHRMRLDLHQAIDSFQRVLAPAPVLGGFVLALALLVWVVAFASDWLAFRLRARAEAVVPAGGLFLFGAILGGHNHRLLAALLFGLAVLVFILFHRTAEHRQSPHWVVGNTTTDSQSLLRTGVALATVTALLGVGVAGALPGHFDTPMVRWRNGHGSGGGTRVTVSPLVDIRQRLVQNADTLLFKVKANRPAYWRLTALDDFDGTVWSSNNEFRANGHQLVDPRKAPGRASEALHQQFTIYSLAQVWAPAAYQPQYVSDGSLLYDETSGTLIVPRNTTTSDSLRYDVISQVPQPAAIDLGITSNDHLSKAFQHHYTQLPHLPSKISSMAKEVVKAAGANTAYDKALALQDWFLQNFTYSLNPGITGEGTDALLEFLTKRTGYCEQFAGTYAAMARGIGLPTRVAVGFTPGLADPKAADTYDVYGRQAHAWPEVYFPSVGWVAFDPTPGRGVPGGQDYTGHVAQQDATPPPQSTGRLQPGTTAPATPGGSPVTRPSRDIADPTVVGHPSSGSGVQSSMVVLGLVLAGLIVVIALLLIALPVAVWLARRRRRRRARSPGQLVTAAWYDACDALTLAGAPPQPAETRLEFADRAAGTVPRAEGAMEELAGLATAAAWAPDGTEAEAVDRADQLASSVSTAVRNRLGRRGLLTALLDPRRTRRLLAGRKR